MVKLHQIELNIPYITYFNWIIEQFLINYSIKILDSILYEYIFILIKLCKSLLKKLLNFFESK